MYVVGSVLEHDDWRDIDVRVVVPEFGAPLRRLDLNMLLSDWGRRTTDLPIDCQVQTEAEAGEFSGPRNPMGRTIR